MKKIYELNLTTKESQNYNFDNDGHFYNKRDVEVAKSKIEEYDNILSHIEFLDSDNCYTRQDLKHYFSSYDFKKYNITPSYKEHFTITKYGKEITCYRYYYTKNDLRKIFIATRNDYIEKLNQYGGCSLNGMIECAESNLAKLQYKLVGLQNQKKLYEELKNRYF